ncbi:MAG: sulfatase, partial [Myxococcales bacterium]|nr:sulfatase [Myxococcales bacterium]
MLDRRQKKIRRAMAGGALIAIAATLPLWLMDAVWVLGVAAPRFDSHMQGFVYALSLGGVLAGLAAIIGGLEGLLALGINALVARVAKQRTAEPRWMALIIAILGAPFCAVVAAQMFAGRRASQITGKHFIAIGVGLGGVAALYGVARVCVAARDRLRVQRWGKSAALALAALCLALAAALYWTDQRVLPRLYPFFHKALAVGVVICCQLAVYALYAGFRPSSPWIGRLAEPQLALIAVAACVGLCAVSIRQVGRSARLLALSHQHAALQSKALSLARGLRIAPRLRPRGLAAPLAGAGSARGTKPRRNKGAPLAAGPRVPDANLLLITVDALRADHLGVYGYKRKTSPNIDSWAKAGGVVFARGYAAVPHTSFSLTSLMTGKHVYSAGTSRHQTLAAVLRRYGYKTGGFFPPAVFYIDGDRFAAFRAARFDFEYVKYEFLDAKARVDQVLSFLRTQGSKRKVFVWAHFFEPHEPYVAHDGFDFGSRGIDRYDGEIAYVDRQIGRLIRGAMALRKQTSVVLTGDHGEAFGEHSSFYHGNTLYEEQVRVPLIISAPGVKPRFVDGPAQTIDIAATLLSLVDIPVPAGMHGRDLGPWLGGEHAERLPPAFSQIEHKKAVTAGHDKLIYDTVWGYSELYDLKKDPAERE